ncbi:MAG: hypothetical protein ACE5EG_09890, partial [Thermoanaerobaculia bacterium]
MTSRPGETRPALSLALSTLFALAVQQAPSAASPQRVEAELLSRPSKGVPSTLAVLAFGGGDGGNLTAFASALPLPSGRDRSPVPFIVELDSSLLPAADTESLILEFFAYALDADRRVRAHFNQKLPLGPREIEAARSAGGLRYAAHLELPVGGFLLRILVHEPRSGRYALRSVRVEIPAAEARASIPVALRFAGDEGAWLTAREARSPAALPDLLDELPIGLPAALPVLAPGREEELDLLFYGFPPADQLLGLAILNAAGKKVGAVELRQAAEPSALGRRQYRLPVSFTVPALAEGSYGLELEAASARSLVHPPQVAVFVVEEPIAEGERWTSLMAKRSGGRASGSSGGAAMGPDGRAAGAVASAYRRAVSRLAGDSETTAVREVAELESRALEGGGDEPLRDLVRGEWRVADELADRDPEVLLPLVSLHLRLDDLYRGERHFLLSSHAQRMAASLATEYAERVTTPEARSIASLALTVLGSDLQASQLWSAAQRLLEQALEIDADNELAIVSLAAGFEKRGLYAEAIGYLERLVDLDPKSAEGRLRLAVNLRRVGERERAAELLRRMIAEANPPWALTLAYQEFGRLYLDDGLWAEAVQLLEDAVARLPRQPRLQLLRAYALDRAGQRGTSEVIADLTRIPAGADPSPRYLYNQRTLGDREEIRRLLARNSAVRLPALADALVET